MLKWVAKCTQGGCPSKICVENTGVAQQCFKVDYEGDSNAESKQMARNVQYRNTWLVCFIKVQLCSLFPLCAGFLI